MADAYFVVIWEFEVRTEAAARFLEVYGADGAWARLFARDPQFVRTELQRDLQHARRYLTLDYWISERAYEEFRSKRREEYEAMDRECEALTEREKLIGRCQVVE